VLRESAGDSGRRGRNKSCDRLLFVMASEIVIHACLLEVKAPSTVVPLPLEPKGAVLNVGWQILV
jgi:hypothetical protein